MEVNFFTSHPLSVKYESRSYDIDDADINRIILASVAASVFFLIGSVFAFLFTSYFFRTKKMKQLSSDLNPHLKTIDQIKNQSLTSRNSPFHELKSQVRTIAQTHINSINTKLVCFYKTGPTEFLGNFANCTHGIKLWGQTFKCSEAAFQWKKYHLAAINNNRNDLLNDSLMKKFFTCGGEEAFRLNRVLGNKYSNLFPSKWRQGERDKVMWEVLNAKFQQNPELAELLQETKGAYLLEHNQAARDDYWSDNSNGTGKNMLGKMLMAIRDKAACPPPNHSFDQHKIKAYTDYANQPGALNYKIF